MSLSGRSSPLATLPSRYKARMRGSACPYERAAECTACTSFILFLFFFYVAGGGVEAFLDILVAEPLAECLEAAGSGPEGALGVPAEQLVLEDGGAVLLYQLLHLLG